MAAAVQALPFSGKKRCKSAVQHSRPSWRNTKELPAVDVRGRRRFVVRRWSLGGLPLHLKGRKISGFTSYLAENHRVFASE
jgi:hypothetical protein